jgi:hypothetical protein
MQPSLLLRTDGWIIAGLLFLGMLLFIWVGHKIGTIRSRKIIQEEKPNIQSIVGGVLGLSALMLAFTFGQSASRFEVRRLIVVQEANALSTAILRSDMYPAPEKEAFRKDFSNYLESRIEYFNVGANRKLIAASLKKSDSIGNQLWKRASELSHNLDNRVASEQMIPALNELFDIGNTRKAGEMAHVPESIVIMMLVLSLCSAFITGYASAEKKKMDWIIISGFCILTCFVIYFIIDLDRPRRGIIRVDAKNIEEVRSIFKD